MTWTKTYIRILEFNEKGGPKYKQLVNAIAEDIQQGKICKGDPLPTVSDYASFNNISRSTVGRAYQVLTKRGITTAKTGVGHVVINDNVSKILFPSDPLPKSSHYFDSQ